MSETTQRRYTRKGFLNRIRHSINLLSWLGFESVNLAASATPDDVVATANAFSAGVLTLTGNAIALVKAGETLTLTGQPLDTETVEVGGKTYVYQTSLTEVDGNVLIGATASISLDNLIAAINNKGGVKGVAYAALMTQNDNVSAAAGTGDTMDVTAKIGGAAGNAITSTETLTNGSWGAGTLSGGTDADTVKLGVLEYTFEATLVNTQGAQTVLIGASASDTIDNLIAAINKTDAGLGILYSDQSKKNELVSAAVGAGDTMGVTALVLGVLGDAVVSTEVMANGSFGAATLVSGVDGILTAATHGISNAEGPYQFTTTDTLPAGLDLTTNYWINVVDANIFQVSRQRAGDPVLLTDTGTGTHTLTKASGDSEIYDLLKTNKPETIAGATDIDDLA